MIDRVGGERIGGLGGYASAAAAMTVTLARASKAAKAGTAEQVDGIGRCRSDLGSVFALAFPRDSNFSDFRKGFK